MHLPIDLLIRLAYSYIIDNKQWIMKMQIKFNKETKKWEIIENASVFRDGEVVGEFETKTQASRYLKMLCSA